jgi:hypothetical protein
VSGDRRHPMNGCVPKAESGLTSVPCSTDTKIVTEQVPHIAQSGERILRLR